MSRATWETYPIGQNQTAPGLVKPYFARADTGTGASLLAETGVLRTRASALTSEVEETHHAAQRGDLLRRASVKVSKGAPALLEELADDQGMSWADIARLVGVSVSAVRKWRSGGQATPEKRRALAELAAFLDLLQESSVQDPASWLEVPFYLPPGYTIRPVELYVGGHLSELLDIACQRRTAADVLDQIDSSWRETRRSTLEVFIAPDGHSALRSRDS